jgi:metal-responsive CopG/Arc/MetJ family transcriptional regulator
MVTKMGRLTASVPQDIIDGTDEIATATKSSRSKIIAECLRERINARKRQLLIEGYKAMAKEHEAFAILSEDAAREALPEWKRK